MRTSEPRPHQINELLVSFDSEVRQTRLRHNDANFGIGTLVWRFRSPHHSCSDSEMRTSEPRPHQINELLVSFDSEVRQTRLRHNDANFGIGTLVWRFRSPHHFCSESEMRISEPKPH